MGGAHAISLFFFLSCCESTRVGASHPSGQMHVVVTEEG